MRMSVELIVRLMARSSFYLVVFCYETRSIIKQVALSSVSHFPKLPFTVPLPFYNGWCGTLYLLGAVGDRSWFNSSQMKPRHQYFFFKAPQLIAKCSPGWEPFWPRVLPALGRWDPGCSPRSVWPWCWAPHSMRHGPAPLDQTESLTPQAVMSGNHRL